MSTYSFKALLISGLECNNLFFHKLQRFTHRIVHAVAKRLVLGEETTGSIRWMGQLWAVDEIIHGRTTSSSSSNATANGWIPVRKVKATLIVVVVAYRKKTTKKEKKLVCIREHVPEGFKKNRMSNNCYFITAEKQVSEKKQIKVAVPSGCSLV